MSMITSDMLRNLGNTPALSGVLLIKNYSIQMTKNNKEYISGTVQSGVEVSFKAWNTSVAFKKLKEEDYTNMPCFISASTDNYGGVASLILTDVTAVADYTVDQFMPIRYDVNAYWNALINLIKTLCSDKAYEIADKILFSNEELAERFKLEYAAMSHHDNCKSGLMAHTYKVVLNMKNIASMYPLFTHENGVASKDMLDLFYLGALFHDIGKCYEMNFGVYQPVSIVNHSQLGAELLSKYKELIVGHYNELWYYNLVSALVQHHGEFGERPKTIVAYLVHRADELDSSLTLLMQNLESATSDSSGKRVRFDNKYLTQYEGGAINEG